MALGAHFTPPPLSFVSAPFYGYLKLKLHGSEESRSRHWSHRGSNREPPAQKARTNQLSLARSQIYQFHFVLPIVTLLNSALYAAVLYSASFTFESSLEKMARFKIRTCRTKGVKAHANGHVSGKK